MTLACDDYVIIDPLDAHSRSRRHHVDVSSAAMYHHVRVIDIATGSLRNLEWARRPSGPFHDNHTRVQAVLALLEHFGHNIPELRTTGGISAPGALFGDALRRSPLSIDVANVSFSK